MSKRDLALLAALYGAWLLCAYLVNAATTGARSPADVVHEWVRFDGIYFRAIAEFGYDEASRIIRWQQGFPFLTAAFPLFPLLIHLAVPLFGGDYTIASVLVPQALTFLVLVALFRLVRLDFTRTAAWLSTLSLMTFPTFYFLLAPYSETLFLLLVILAFHAYRTSRLWQTRVPPSPLAAAASGVVPEKPTGIISRAALRGEGHNPPPRSDLGRCREAPGLAVAAGLLGALASAARIVGAPLLLCTFALDGLYQVWRARPAASSAGQEQQGDTPQDTVFRVPRTSFLLLALIPLGLLIYLLYQWWDFGNPLLFLRGHASSEWKVGFDPLGPVRGLLLPVYSILARDWTSDIFRTNIFNSLFYYFGLALSVYACRRLPAVYGFYTLLAVIVPTLSGSLISMPRFLLIAFPIFIGMGLLLEAHPRLRLLLPLLGLAGLLAMRLFFQTVFLG